MRESASSGIMISVEIEVGPYTEGEAVLLLIGSACGRLQVGMRWVGVPVDAECKIGVTFRYSRDDRPESG